MPGFDRFVRVPTELLEALLETPLNGTQWRILFWIIRHTLGWNRSMTSFSWYRIARELALDRGGVVRAGTRLIQSGILAVVGDQVGVQQDHSRWPTLRLAPRDGKAMTDISADTRHRKALTGVPQSADDSHRKRCQESSLFRRAKDRCKDNLKTYKDRPSQKPDDAHRGASTDTSVERRLLAGAAKPIPGKYDRLSQN